MKTYF